jgi:HD-like signal output (HDOD) protein
MDTTSTRTTTLQKIQQTLSKTEHLPPTPEVLVSLLKAIDDPETSAETVGDLVAMDAALSLSMLRLVNSAAYGLVRKVEKIQDTVVFIGFDEIKNLSVAIAMKTGLIGAAPICHTFHRKALWANFLAAAVASRMTGEALDLPEKGVAFSAGLLRDVGLLLLDGTYPHKLEFVITELATSDQTLCELEREVFGYTHGEVGMWLGEEWRIPRVLLSPMIQVECPWESRNHATVCALVHVGDRLAQELHPYHRPQMPPKISPRALEILDADPTLIDRVRAGLPDEMKRLAVLLD